jgi:hypothetical protein
MEEEKVGIDVAILAKEKGFDEWCDGCYIRAKKTIDDIFGKNVIHKGDYHEDNTTAHNNKHCIDDNDYWETFSRPTQAFLVQWLRIKYHLDVRVAINSLTCYFPMIALIDIDGTQMKGPAYKNYGSYEKAMEAGLHEALLLIGKKNEKDIKLFE